MPFETGNTYGKGRPKGSRNKITGDIKRFLYEVCHDYFAGGDTHPLNDDDELIYHRFVNDIKYLTAKDRVKVFQSILKHLPEFDQPETEAVVIESRSLLPDRSLNDPDRSLSFIDLYLIDR